MIDSNQITKDPVFTRGRLKSLDVSLYRNATLIDRKELYEKTVT